jgi:hypothetical protein
LCHKTSPKKDPSPNTGRTFSIAGVAASFK